MKTRNRSSCCLFSHSKSVVLLELRRGELLQSTSVSLHTRLPVFLQLSLASNATLVQRPVQNILTATNKGGDIKAKYNTVTILVLGKRGRCLRLGGRCLSSVAGRSERENRPVHQRERPVLR